ncbi:hypothetical protein VNO80_06573 [Phaseolus coccineus]|uniref:At3g05675-like ankyrin-like domain-containing protein n=1 Tax=Phaseolus coccineus TaxID=3886 RepID=A0AAN9REL8_PHACN
MYCKEMKQRLMKQSVSRILPILKVYFSYTPRLLTCLNSLLELFKQAAEPSEDRVPLAKSIALEADNLTWLLEILVDKQAADEFALMWANQQELAVLHAKLPTVSRYLLAAFLGDCMLALGEGSCFHRRTHAEKLDRMIPQLCCRKCPTFFIGEAYDDYSQVICRDSVLRKMASSRKRFLGLVFDDDENDVVVVDDDVGGVVQVELLNWCS